MKRLYGKLNADGSLTDIAYREAVTWPDGAEVPVAAMPADSGPWTYDAIAQAAVPVPPTTHQRQQAVAMLTSPQAEMKLLRALLLQTVEDRNALISQYNALLGWLGAQTTLQNRAALNGLSVAQTTPAATRAALTAKINNGAADV